MYVREMVLLENLMIKQKKKFMVNFPFVTHRAK